MILDYSLITILYYLISILWKYYYKILCFSKGFCCWRIVCTIYFCHYYSCPFLFYFVIFIYSSLYLIYIILWWYCILSIRSIYLPFYNIIKLLSFLDMRRWYISRLRFASINKIHVWIYLILLFICFLHWITRWHL